LITGSNASGKSTFIKALAINGILAQTLLTCAAGRFQTRPSLIITSMAMRDDISKGDSYFIVEIKSLKRIMDLVRKYPCVCYIDEVLRGTNTVERIAASVSVLEYLHARRCLCVVASHDIELADILAAKFDNYHFCERVTDDGITFDYKLKHGAATTKNAIRLLGFMGFGEEIVDKANQLSCAYEEKGSWRG
jgi:DNA mismatch repair ATPase MutS